MTPTKLLVLACALAVAGCSADKPAQTPAPAHPRVAAAPDFRVIEHAPEYVAEVVVDSTMMGRRVLNYRIIRVEVSSSHVRVWAWMRWPVIGEECPAAQKDLSIEEWRKISHLMPQIDSLVTP